MPPLHGILETALSVADIQRSADFYRRLFGFDTLLETERLIALSVADRNVLLLFPAGQTDDDLEFPGGIIPGHGTTGRHHLAFSIDAEDFSTWRRQLESAGVAIESVVTWPGGAESLYFRDPDDHLVELITRGFWKIY